MSIPAGKLPLPELAEMKRRGDRIVMVTAYDMPGARFAEDAGIDMILVGDTAAMVVLGHEGTTVPVTMDEMLFLTRTVVRAVNRPIVVGDMPFGSYQVSDEDAVRNAIRFVKEAGADVVKLEGAGPMVPRARAIVQAGIGVVGHIGLTPQSATLLGGFKTQGKTAAAARELVDGALALEAAGCVALVLEAVPAPVADEITRRLEIPTIGIGAGSGCDGQVLVYHDLLGLTEGHLPRFVKRYANLSREIRDALEAYAAEVRSGAFPGPEHTYSMSEEELEAFRTAVGLPTRDPSSSMSGCAGGEARRLQSARRRHPRRVPLLPDTLALQSAYGSTANAATMTPASPRAPTTPRHGSRNVSRRPIATSASDHATNASPIATTTSRPAPSSSPPDRNQSAPKPSTIAGTSTTSESAIGSAAKPIT